MSEKQLKNEWDVSTFDREKGELTGSEWLARFRDEFPRAGLLLELQDFHAQVMEAARRASGVDE